MKIHITKAEYKTLLTMLDISDWIMSCMDVEENPKTVPFKKLEQKFLALAKQFHCEDLVELNKKYNTYYHTRKFEDESASMEFVDKYTNEIFWEELVNRLAKRDTIAQEGKEEFLKMETIERFEKIGKFEDKYNEEFYKHGLKNLKITTENK